MDGHGEGSCRFPVAALVDHCAGPDQSRVHIGLQAVPPRALSSAIVAPPFEPFHDAETWYREQAGWPTGGEDRPVIIGIAGGSGSGKTTIAESVVAAVGAETVSLIQHDAYYRDLPHLDLEERATVNYDHPDSLETELLIEHINRLRAGEANQRPVYDFTIHRRTAETVAVRPEPVVVIEGILVLSERALRDRHGSPHLRRRGCGSPVHAQAAA